MGLKAINLLSKTIITLLLLAVSTVVSAGSVWDGSVSVARYGYLPQTGMYAASNAFPQNTRITVTNPDTGKSVDVIVLERLEDNNLFLVLSFDAAESVGIGYGEIFHGSISEQVATGPGTDEDLPYNPDPDINPSALSGEYSELALIQEYIDNELGGVDESLIIPDTEVKPEVLDLIPVPDDSDPELVEEVAVIVEDISEPVLVSEDLVPELIKEAEDEPDIPLVENMPPEDVYVDEPDDFLPTPDLVELTPASDLVEDDIPLVVGMSASVPSVVVASADISDEIPELPVPAEDRPVITAMSMEILEETETKIAISELPELPIIDVEEVLSDETPVAVTMTADVIEIEEVEDISPILPLVVTVTEPVIEPPGDDELVMDVEVVLEPSDLRPPVVDIVEETEAVDTVVEEITSVTEPVEVAPLPAAATYNLTRVLAEDSYYLQLGAYREQYSALDLAGSLGGMYPVTVFITDSADAFNYKVMVGPLGQDESGAILYSFRSRGYPDAFLRKGL